MSAYNRNHYNPDALPAHVEPDQAAAILSKHDRRNSRESKPQPPLPNDRYNRPAPDPRNSGSYDRPGQRPGRDDYGRPPPPRDSYGSGGGRREDYGRPPPPRDSYGGITSPPPSSYGQDNRHGPPPGGHGRPPANFRPPPTPAPPRDGNDRDALWPMFKSVDKDNSGQLSERELKTALVNGDWSAFDPHTVRMMIRMFDADRNGSIDFDEFCGLWGFLSAWRNLFDRFDLDRSGNISYSEFKDALVAFGYKLSPTFVSLIFRTYDRRGENAMSFDLFVQACISLKRMTDVFKKYDEDRDGYITLSFEEFLTEILNQLD